MKLRRLWGELKSWPSGARGLSSSVLGNLQSSILRRTYSVLLFTTSSSSFFVTESALLSSPFSSDSIRGDVGGCVNGNACFNGGVVEPLWLSYEGGLVLIISVHVQRYPVGAHILWALEKGLSVVEKDRRSV